MLNEYNALIQVGATGAFLVLVWKHLINKDRKMSELFKELNRERSKLYEGMEDLVRETVKALSDKNNTDELMSRAIEKLTEELRNLKNENTKNRRSN